MKKHNEPADATPIMLMFVYGFGMIFYFIFFFAGLHAFRVSRKLFKLVSSLDIFDDNVCVMGYLDKESSVSNTRECLCGYIDGYPVIVSFNLAVIKGESSRLDFGMFTTKFNRPHVEQLSIQLNWLRGYKPVSDIKDEVAGFIGVLRSKSPAKSSFDSMVGDRYSNLTLDSHVLKV